MASRFVARTGGEIRVRGPGQWGVPCADLPKGRILANSYFLYCRYAAQCLVPVGEPNPLKCSTSKRYGIWIAEEIGSDLVSSSELRYALSGVDLDTGRANLELAELAAEVTSLRELVHSKVAEAMGTSPSLDEAEGDRTLIREQRRSLQPGHLRLTDAKAVLDRHLASDPECSVGWMATFCALAEPFMPALVTAVREGRPTESAVHRGILLPTSLETIVRRRESQVVMAGETP